MQLLQQIRKLFPARWDDTMQQIWDAKLEAEIEEARKAAGLLRECSEELTTMANGALHPNGHKGLKT